MFDRGMLYPWRPVERKKERRNLMSKLHGRLFFSMLLIEVAIVANERYKQMQIKALTFIPTLSET